MSGPAHLRPVAWLSLAILVLTLGINGLSAWIRHTEAGLGCPERATCYGLIGPLVTQGEVAARTAGAPRAALSPRPAAKRLHRAAATALVIAVLVLLHRTRGTRRLRGREAHLPYLMAALLLGLSVIGPASYLKTLPAVATANLLGGVALAACAWRLWLGTSGLPRAAVTGGPSRRLLNAAALALLAQIALGAWQSANFAGLACAGGRDCVARATPGEAANAFWYLRTLPLDAGGKVVSEAAAPLIHLAHRGGALLSSLLLVAVLLRLRRAEGRLRVDALAAALLLGAQLCAGVLVLRHELPLAGVLTHHALATLLLLALLRLRYRVLVEPPR